MRSLYASRLRPTPYGDGTLRVGASASGNSPNKPPNLLSRMRARVVSGLARRPAYRAHV
jgi:hypothetical protein